MRWSAEASHADRYLIKRQMESCGWLPCINIHRCALRKIQNISFEITTWGSRSEWRLNKLNFYPFKLIQAIQTHFIHKHHRKTVFRQCFSILNIRDLKRNTKMQIEKKTKCVSFQHSRLCKCGRACFAKHSDKVVAR